MASHGFSQRFACCAFFIAATGAAQTNLGFEDDTLHAWAIRDGRAALDASTFVDGKQSLRMQGRGRVEQSIPAAIAGNRVKISVQAKADAPSAARLWVRVDARDVRLFIGRAGGLSGSGPRAWTQYTVEAPLGPEAERISFGLQLGGDGSAWFDALTLESLDTRSRPMPAADAEHYLRYALDLIEANSLMRHEIDWPSLRTRTIDQARGAASPAGTHLALQYALGALGDGHSYLMSPEQNDRISATPVSNARTGRRFVAPHAETLSAVVSYVSLPGYAGGTQAQQVEFSQSVHELIAQMDHGGHCGWIVDLRDNTGGNLWPMLAAIGPLLGDGDAGAALHPDGQRVPFWYRGGRAGLGDYVQLRVPAPAYELKRSLPPVAVLFGARTASSGEVIAAAFRGRAHAASFGTPTRGLSTGNRTFPLRDGAALVLTVAATSDPTGRVLVGALEPDHTVDAEPRRIDLSTQPSVKAALEWLSTECQGVFSG